MLVKYIEKKLNLRINSMKRAFNQAYSKEHKILMRVPSDLKTTIIYT